METDKHFNDISQAMGSQKFLSYKFSYLNLDFVTKLICVACCLDGPGVQKKYENSKNQIFQVKIL